MNDKDKTNLYAAITETDAWVEQLRQAQNAVTATIGELCAEVLALKATHHKLATALRAHQGIHADHLHRTHRCEFRLEQLDRQLRAHAFTIRDHWPNANV
jgi:phage shock protein A